MQLLPELAKIVKKLYVFQRTPSSIDVRDQRETSVEEFAEWSKEPVGQKPEGRDSRVFPRGALLSRQMMIIWQAGCQITKFAKSTR